YTWTNDNPSIGLPASGTGNLPSFTAVNGTATPQYAFINVVPQGNGTSTCAGKQVRFRITVNPTPTVSAVGDQVYCRGILTAPVAFTGNMGTEATYSWRSSSTATGLTQTRGTDVVPAFTTMNPTAGTLSSTITVTPSANKCLGTPVSFQYQVGNCVTQSGGTGPGDGATARTAAVSFQAQVSASPNPARDRVTVVLNGTSKEAGSYTVQVLDGFGRPVGRPQAFSGNSTSVDLSGLSAGSYLLQVTSSKTGQTAQKQVIKL
ncbi:MAG: T9SS type A sorting domain-containing protein, partial [Chitinophagaceae bacterium]